MFWLDEFYFGQLNFFFTKNQFCSHIPFSYGPATAVGFFKESRSIRGQRTIENPPIVAIALMAIAMAIGHIRLARGGTRVVCDKAGAGVHMIRKVVFVRNRGTGKLIPLHLLLFLKKKP